MIEIDLITKHGKKALGMNAAPAHPTGWRHRLSEILLEIGIIVFAITLSIQLHSWHQHTVERAEERQFLTGLRADLKSDLVELRGDSLTYVKLVRAYQYFQTLSPQTARVDSTKKYRWMLYNTTNLMPNSSRFEGFKSAGKLGLIADTELLNDILEYYQENIPSLLNETRGFSTYKERTIQQYLDEHLHRSEDNFLAVMQSDQMYHYLNKASLIQVITHRYHEVLQQTRKIIRETDSQLASK